MTFLKMLTVHYRINRYIMECKCGTEHTTRNQMRRINRYIMECKYLCGKNIAFLLHRINRYIMECKLDFHSIFF